MGAAKINRFISKDTRGGGPSVWHQVPFLRGCVCARVCACVCCVFPSPCHILTLHANLSSRALPNHHLSSGLYLSRQVAGLQMSTWMPFLICPRQAASCPSLMQGDSHKRSGYEANRRPFHFNKRGHDSEPHQGSQLLSVLMGRNCPII